MHLLALARRYLSAGWEHRWKSLALAWLICFAGWFGVYSLPDQYQSSARIYADADQVLGAALRGIAIDSQTAAQVDLLQRTLLSRPNLEKVIVRTDLDLRAQTPTERENLLQRLQKDIRIQPQTRSLFTLSYTSDNPKLARDVVNTVLNLFIEQAASSDRQQMENARGFINQQIAAYEAQLREAERRRAEFRTRYLEILPQDALGGASRLEQIRSRLQELRGELQDATTRRNLTQQQLEKTPAVVTEELAASLGLNNGGRPTESRLAEAERTLRELRLRYTDRHPDVIAAQGIVNSLRASGDGRNPTGNGGTGRQAGRPNPLYEQLRVRLVDADAQIASIERQIRNEETELTRIDALARSAPQVQAEFLNLDRDYTVLSKQYEELLARRESLQVAGQARTSADRVRLEIVDPPIVPNQPSGPNRFLLSTAVLVIGLGAGGALAIFLVLLNRAFYTVQDLRGLGLPVLGAISPAVPRQRPVGAMVVFACGIAMLAGAYGGVLMGGPKLIAKIPALVQKVLA